MPNVTHHHRPHADYDTPAERLRLAEQDAEIANILARQSVVARTPAQARVEMQIIRGARTYFVRYPNGVVSRQFGTYYEAEAALLCPPY